MRFCESGEGVRAATEGDRAQGSCWTPETPCVIGLGADGQVGQGARTIYVRCTEVGVGEWSAGQ